MKSKGFITSFTVAQSPEEVMKAIQNVRGWWSENIHGRTDECGAEFEFQSKGFHRSTQRITELVPEKRVVWQVTDSHLSFVEDEAEWTGTEIVFEIARQGDRTELRFTHVGLVPAIECYGDCSGAWGFYVNESLRGLIATGKGQPETKALAAGGA